MKRLICLLMVLCLVPISALSTELPDITQYSADQLLTLWQSAGERLKEIGAYPYVQLESGSQGVDVTNAQKRLTALYYYTGDLTGVFDAATVKAVKTFEKANGIKPDGKLSIDEQDLLYNSSAVAKATPTPSPSPTPAPTPIPESKALQVSSVRLSDYYNTKVFSIKLKNYSETETIDAFTIAHKCYDSYDTLLSTAYFNAAGIEYADWWKDLSLRPGRTFSMGSYFWYLFDYQTCSRVDAAVSKYHTKSGKTVNVDPDDYIWVSGELK